MATKASDTTSGNQPNQLISGLVEDRMKRKDTVRDQINQAITTLIVRLPQLPEHQKEDADDAQRNTSDRLGKLMQVINTHFEVE